MSARISSSLALSVLAFESIWTQFVAPRPRRSPAHELGLLPVSIVQEHLIK